MRLPAPGKLNIGDIQKVIDICFQSRGDRMALYQGYRNLYLTGTPEGKQARFNNIYPHIDLLTSFLFSGETVMFEIEHEEEKGFRDLQARALAAGIKERWHDGNADVLIYDAINWSLVYNSMFIKVLPNKEGAIDYYIVEPHDVGVFREDISGLSDQEAVAHRYLISKYEVKRILASKVKAGLITEAEAIKQYRRISSASNVQDEGGMLPASVQKMILSASSPDMKGSLSKPFYQFSADALTPRVPIEDMCVGTELWVFDDEMDDYRCITYVAPDVIIWDRPNYYIKKEIPFVQICPNRTYNYFFGMSEIMNLATLQKETADALGDISRLIKKVVDPPVRGVGVTGLAQDLKTTLNNPGSFTPFQNMASKIDDQKVELRPEIYTYFEKLLDMFDTVSGTSKMLKGEGTPGVRAGSHANLLARFGGARTKQKALIIEDSIEKLADLTLKLMRKYDKTHYHYVKDEEPIPFVANDFNVPFKVKVSAHSASPVFVEPIIEQAFKLFDEGVIDGEILIETIQFPYRNVIRERLKKKEKQAAIAAQLEAAQQGQKGGGK